MLRTPSFPVSASLRADRIGIKLLITAKSNAPISHKSLHRRRSQRLKLHLALRQQASTAAYQVAVQVPRVAHQLADTVPGYPAGLSCPEIRSAKFYKREWETTTGLSPVVPKSQGRSRKWHALPGIA